MLKAEGGVNSSGSIKTVSEAGTIPSSNAKEPEERSSSENKRPHKKEIIVPPRTSSIEAQQSHGEALQRHALLSPAGSVQQQIPPAKVSNESNRSGRPSLAKRPSDDSIKSNFSTTSSVFSTASKISRLPHAVKNSFVSVKDFVALKAHRNKTKTQNRLTIPQQQYQEPALTSPHLAQTIHYNTLGSSTYSDRETSASRLRRRTPSTMGLVSMFSSPSTAGRKDEAISPSSSTSSSILEVKDARGSGKTNRRSSVVNAAARLLRRDETSKSPLRSRVSAIDEDEDETSQLGFSDEFEQVIQEAADQRAVGKLLFGVDIGSIDFFDQDFARSATSSTISSVSHLDTEASDAKSDHITSKPSAQEVVWGRQRAKSCQETKVPSLRQLAKGHYASSTAALLSNPTIPPPPVPVGKFTPEEDGVEILPVARPEMVPEAHDKFDASAATAPVASCDTILVTATLTTLHSKLISDCDQTLASTILPSSKSSNSLVFPEERLQNIAYDLWKMSNMVKWEDGDGPLSKTAIAAYFDSLDQQIAQGKSLQVSRKKGDGTSNQAVANAVKEIISSLKQMVNQCVCQYHKVTERAMVIPCKGFKIEGANRFGAVKEDYPQRLQPRDYSEWPVEHIDEEAYFYRKYFVGKDYVTFVGYVNDNEPLLISAIRDEGQYRLIIRGKQGPDIRKVVPDSFLLNAPSDADTQMETVSDSTWKAVVETSSDISLNQLKKIDKETVLSLGLENEILRLDESAVHSRYKFGVVYVKEGQIREEEWFSNDHESEKFNRFLGIIGRRVELLGYPGWTAGLDTKGGDSGEYTFVNEWKEHSIAYHVAPLIPSRRGDKQHIQRKRHIGNDIVCIVFAEGKQPFNPAAIKSQFLHVFIVVHEEEWEGKIGWRVEVATADPVPAFGPPLPEKAFFYDESELRSFMLAKLINAEYAAYKSPKFTQPMARARGGILSNLVERASKHAQEPSLSQTRHNKSPSTSSEKSTRSTGANSSDVVVPAASRSSMIKEGIANLGRRRSGQSSDPSRSRQIKPRKAKASKATEGCDQQSRSRSELDLLHPSSSTMTTSRSSGAVLQSSGKKDDRIRIRNRAHNILSSTLSNISGGGSARPK